MGWANCGTDPKGREIGYAHEATCDHPDCHEEIDRGLSYVCGGMHGGDGIGCGDYFCGEHMTYMETKAPYKFMQKCVQVCYECEALSTQKEK